MILARHFAKVQPFRHRSAPPLDTGAIVSSTGAEIMTASMKLLVSFLVILAVAGCATPGYQAYPYRGTLTGAAVGAAGGALLGHAADGGRGALLGGTVGALVGGATGYYFDQKRRNAAPYNEPYGSPYPPHYRPRHFSD